MASGGTSEGATYRPGSAAGVELGLASNRPTLCTADAPDEQLLSTRMPEASESEAAKPRNANAEKTASCTETAAPSHSVKAGPDTEQNSSRNPGSNLRSFSSYPDFKRTLIATATHLNTLAGFASDLGLEREREAIGAMAARLNTDRFVIAVLGEFKRGKSTFINALLGREILPADVEPCSATINRIVWGREPSARIHLIDGDVLDIGLGELPRFVTKLTPDAELTSAGVKEAVVSYPTLFCQNNVEIIDTPGLADDPVMTERTLSVLPEVDAAVLVVSAIAPLAQSEQEFLIERLLEMVDPGRIFFVINRTDALPAGEIDRVIAFVRQRLNNLLARYWEARQPSPEPKKPQVHLFGLSSWHALQAKLSHDSLRMLDSRFRDFEVALERFLARDRGTAVLRPVLDLLQMAGAGILAAVEAEVERLVAEAQRLSDRAQSLRAAAEDIIQEAVQREKGLAERGAEVRQILATLAGSAETEITAAARLAIEAADVPITALAGSDQATETITLVGDDAVTGACATLAARCHRALDDWIGREQMALGGLRERLAEAVATAAEEGIPVNRPPLVPTAESWVGLERGREEIRQLWTALSDPPILAPAAPDAAATPLNMTAALGVLGRWTSSASVRKGFDLLTDKIGGGTAEAISGSLTSVQVVIVTQMRRTAATRIQASVRSRIAHTRAVAETDRLVTGLASAAQATVDAEVADLERGAHTLLTAIEVEVGRRGTFAAHRRAELDRIRTAVAAITRESGVIDGLLADAHLPTAEVANSFEPEDVRPH